MRMCACIHAAAPQAAVAAIELLCHDHFGTSKPLAVGARELLVVLLHTRAEG